jgi:hypothetical protein
VTAAMLADVSCPSRISPSFFAPHLSFLMTRQAGRASSTQSIPRAVLAEVHRSEVFELLGPGGSSPRGVQQNKKARPATSISTTDSAMLTVSGTPAFSRE